MKVSREILSVAAKVAIYPARLVQLGSLVITGYAVCYLVWMHHFHYCAFYGCGARVPDGVSVPLGEVLLITAVRKNESVSPLQAQTPPRLAMLVETDPNFTVRPRHAGVDALRNYPGLESRYRKAGYSRYVGTVCLLMFLAVRLLDRPRCLHIYPDSPSNMAILLQHVGEQRI